MYRDNKTLEIKSVYTHYHTHSYVVTCRNVVLNFVLTEQCGFFIACFFSVLTIVTWTCCANIIFSGWSNAAALHRWHVKSSSCRQVRINATSPVPYSPAVNLIWVDHDSICTENQILHDSVHLFLQCLYCLQWQIMFVLKKQIISQLNQLSNYFRHPENGGIKNQMAVIPKQ